MSKPSPFAVNTDQETPVPQQVHPWIRLAFEALMSDHGNYGLMPCLVCGEPSAAIVMASPCEDGMEIMPLFVALTPTLNLKMAGRSRGSGGGPAREDVARAFAANVASFTRS